MYGNDDLESDFEPVMGYVAVNDRKNKLTSCN